MSFLDFSMYNTSGSICNKSNLKAPPPQRHDLVRSQPKKKLSANLYTVGPRVKRQSQQKEKTVKKEKKKTIRHDMTRNNMNKNSPGLVL